MKKIVAALALFTISLHGSLTLAAMDQENLEVTHATTTNSECQSELLSFYAQEGDIENVKCALAKGANPDGDNRYTPLMAACSNGHRDVVALLLQENASLNTLHHGYTALVHAIQGNSFNRPQMAYDLTLDLIRAGTDVNASNGQFTALIMAATHRNAPVVDVLLAEGALVNTQVGTGRSALFAAVEWADMAIVNTLLLAKANASVYLDNGFTVLMEAAVRGDSAIVEALLKAGADPNVRMFDKNYTALDWAIKHGNSDIVTILDPITDKL